MYSELYSQYHHQALLYINVFFFVIWPTMHLLSRFCKGGRNRIYNRFYPPELIIKGKLSTVNIECHLQTQVRQNNRVVPNQVPSSHI